MTSGETTPHSSEIDNSAILSPGAYASDGTIALHPLVPSKNLRSRRKPSPPNISKRRPIQPLACEMLVSSDCEERKATAGAYGTGNSGRNPPVRGTGNTRRGVRLGGDRFQRHMNVPAEDPIFGEDSIFSDRAEAGRKIAARLTKYKDERPVVLAIPRGGVPAAFEVARALNAPLDVAVVRKLGAPGQPELGIGAIVDGDHPEEILNQEIIGALHVSRDYLNREIRNQLKEIHRRRQLYRSGRPRLELEDRSVIIVDDGIATGGSVRAALRGIRRTNPKTSRARCSGRPARNDPTVASPGRRRGLPSHTGRFLWSWPVLLQLPSSDGRRSYSNARFGAAAAVGGRVLSRIAILTGGKPGLRRGLLSANHGFRGDAGLENSWRNGAITILPEFVIRVLNHDFSLQTNPLPG